MLSHYRVFVIEGRCAAGNQGADVRGATICVAHCRREDFSKGREAVAILHGSNLFNASE
jgi:hypothetical protein